MTPRGVDWPASHPREVDEAPVQPLDPDPVSDIEPPPPTELSTNLDAGSS